MHEVNLETRRCLCCSGTGVLKAKRAAAQANGPSVVYDEITTPCLLCNGTGLAKSVAPAPRSHRIEK